MRIRPKKNITRSRKPKSFLQSTIEYLMSYGWAIVTLAVVLGVLFYLGVFNLTVPNVCTAATGFIC